MSQPDASLQQADSRARGLKLFLLAALIALATMGKSATHEFVDWDDRFLLADNPKFNPPTWRSILGFVLPRNLDENLYIPVTQLAWGLLAAIGHTDHADAQGSLLNPWVFHCASLAIHVASIGVVLAILRSFVADGPAFFGTLIFAIHPVQVETVAWASGFRDLLAAFFGFVALYELIQFRKTDRRAAWIIATAAAALSMLSKPSAVALPLEAVIVDMILLRTRYWRSLTLLFPWFLMVIPIVAITRSAQSMQWPIYSPYFDRPIVALDAIAFYFAKIVFPINLAIDYGRTPARVISGGWRIIWIMPLILAAVLFWRGRRSPILYGGCLLAIAGVAPVLGFVSFAAQDYSTVSDHYLYPSMLGIGFVGAVIAQAIVRHSNKVIFYVTATVILAAMGAQSFAMSGVWSDSASLFTNALAVNPASSIANSGLASVLAESGDVRRAAGHYETAQQLNPHNGMAIMGMANLLMHEGDVDGAAIQFERLMRVYQMQPNFDAKLGAAGEIVVAARLSRLGDTAGAVAALQQAKQWDPSNPQIDPALARARAALSTRPATVAHAPH